MSANNLESLLSQSELLHLREQMTGFARNQLNNDAHAQDAVQEALYKAVKFYDSFKAKSAYKSWVFSILKNTIIDMLRQQSKDDCLSEFNAEQSNDELLDALFDNSGHWQNNYRPSQWTAPEQSYENDEFWQVLDICLNELPAEQSRVFMMREYIGLDTQEICSYCNISSSNYYVLMYRARLKLQVCLSINWFD